MYDSLRVKRFYMKNEVIYPEEYKPEPNSALITREKDSVVAQTMLITQTISSVVNTTMTSISQIVAARSQVEVEIAKLDHMLDSLVLKAQRDIEIYKQTIPTINAQFNRFQDRMDKLMDRAIDMLTSDVSDNALSRQEAIMSLIETTNDAMNRLIGKLLPQGY